MTKSSVELSVTPSVSLSTYMPYVGIQSLQTANITGNNSLEIIGVKVTRIESVPSSSATSILMENSSTQIVPSQSLSSPSSNFNILVSKSSIVYSSMISLMLNTTSISSIPIQVEYYQHLCPSLAFRQVQQRHDPILLSSFSLLVTSTKLTSVSMGIPISHH